MDKVSLPVILPAVKPVLRIRMFLYLLVLLSLLTLTACSTGGIYHTVKPGQNLYRIGRTYHVDEQYLARINGIRDPARIDVGDRIFIPGAERVLRVPDATSHATHKTIVPGVENRRVTPRKQQPEIKKSQSVPTPPLKPKRDKPRQVRSHATDIEKLQWPLRGKVVRPFSRQAKAGSGRGIEIAVKAGSTVVAAEAGKVIYSGDGVNGYGFLLILQHENDFYTVYGFNRKNLVKQGDYVSRGEHIALSGTPPAGGKPRLHFEVRKGKVAVDPILYLP